MEYFNIKVLERGGYITFAYEEWMMPGNVEYSMAYTNEIILERKIIKHKQVFKLRYGSN